MTGETKRIQRSRAKGWRMPEGAVYVGRGTVWGNPFVVGKDSGIFPETNEVLCPAISLETSLKFYRDMVTGFISPEMFPHGHDWMRRWHRSNSMHPVDAARTFLRGKTLVCWCPLDRGCHADILLEACEL